MSCAEMAEPIDLPFGLWTSSGGPKKAPVQSYSSGGDNVKMNNRLVNMCNAFCAQSCKT